MGEKGSEIEIFLTMTTAAAATRRSRRFLYALDFDGVLVDSAAELALSGYAAAKQLFADAPWLTKLSKQTLVDKFREIRPCLETGWEAPLLLKLLADEQYTHDEIMKKFHEGLREDTMTKLNVNKETCNCALKKARNDWISKDSNDWLDAHGFYSGACEAVRQLLKEGHAEDVYIITTKAADFTERLLEKQGLFGPDAVGGGIPSNHIYGLGSPPKNKVLASLLQERNASSLDQEWFAVFVEDRLLTLENTMADEAVCQQVVPVLAGWGYNTPQQRAKAKEEGFIVLNDSDSLSEVLGDEKQKGLEYCDRTI